MSVGDLVKVWTDVGARKPVPLLAKIEDVEGVIFTIRYLSESGPDHAWFWEDDTYEIDDESIAEFLRTNRLEDVGFRSFGDFWIKVDTDEDYVPESDEEEETDEDEDEDEDEDDASDEFDDDDDDLSDSEESLDEE